MLWVYHFYTFTRCFHFVFLRLKRPGFPFHGNKTQTKLEWRWKMEKRARGRSLEQDSESFVSLSVSLSPSAHPFLSLYFWQERKQEYLVVLVENQKVEHATFHLNSTVGSSRSSYILLKSLFFSFPAVAMPFYLFSLYHSISLSSFCSSGGQSR